MISIMQNNVCEWSFLSAVKHTDPFNDITLNVLFTGPDGKESLVPAFWAGGETWKARFSSPVTGKYTLATNCSDDSDAGLHGQEGEFCIEPYHGDNPLYEHGPLVASKDKRHFEHKNGTPFFWLGDTWWMGFTKRMEWPFDFQTLALDRLKKGFSAVQIITGLYPDMPQFDERGANEAGFPWEKDYTRINPAYFDYADRRIQYLVDLGIVPCIVGCWGYYLRFMGIEKMKQHWRYLVARYGAYPVVWCLAGEGAMPYYLSDSKESDAAFQQQGWTDMGKYVRSIDPFDHLITIHPTDFSRNQVEDPAVLDFEMLQTGHGDRQSLPTTVEHMRQACAEKPRMPVINSEVCYEGIGEACRQEVQRLMFWASILNGAAGHTYGANGIWQVNKREKPYGPSPHGMAWGNTPWEDAMNLPGSSQLGLSKRLLEKYPWWRFEPHPEWIEPHWSKDNYFAPYAAGIPGEVRIIYFPHSWWGTGRVTNLERGKTYHAYLFNPVDGVVAEIGPVSGDDDGNWDIHVGNTPWRTMPIYQDWVLVMTTEAA